jgi:hypothetical protein
VVILDCQRIQSISEDMSGPYDNYLGEHLPEGLLGEDMEQSERSHLYNRKGKSQHQYRYQSNKTTYLGNSDADNEHMNEFTPDCISQQSFAAAETSYGQYGFSNQIRSYGDESFTPYPQPPLQLHMPPGFHMPPMAPPGFFNAGMPQSGKPMTLSSVISYFLLKSNDCSSFCYYYPIILSISAISACMHCAFPSFGR